MVRAVEGGCAFGRRVASLGLIPGIDLTVLQNHGRGPVLILVRDLRLALGRREATRVLVEVSVEPEDTGP